MTRHLRIALAGALVPLGWLSAGSIPEPPTLVYGRVVRLMGGREFPVTTGTLSWTIRPTAAGTPAVTLSTVLGSRADGALCYRMAIPHEALIAGLAVSAGAVPLTAAETIHELAEITVDGVPARPLLASSAYLALSQAGRGKGHRVDLVLGDAAGDTDGDGLPDLWETAFGLNPDENDADADPDGDGLSNRQEYARGSDPRTDNRAPAMLTAHLTAYASCRTGVLLDVADSDTPPAGLTITLADAPAGARLLLTAAGGGETVLAQGSSFTLADVHAGKLVLEELAGSTDPRSVRFLLNDDTPGRQAVSVDLPVAVSRPAAMASGWLTQAPARLEEVLSVTGLALPADRTEQVAWVAGRWFGRTIWQADAPHAPADFAAPGAAVLLGGPGDDTLTGSNASDLLCTGAGADTLAGGGGADVFLFEAGMTGAKTVADFSASEEDTLDFSAVLRGPSNRLSDYLRATVSGPDVVLDIDASGRAAAYADGSVRLLGAADSFDLAALWASGRIVAATLTSPTLVTATVAEGDGQASETGPRAGRFTLRRLGRLEGPLTVAFDLAGSAVWGSDYEPVPRTVTFPAGAAVITVDIVPLVDNVVEPVEKVILTVLPGEGYEAGAPSTASVDIADLAELVSLRAVEAQALVAEGQPGTILVQRTGMLARPATVWLSVRGTAAPGTDFAALPARVSFAAWETAVYLDVQPLPTAAIAGACESVVVTLQPDPAGQYTVGDPPAATVWLYADAAAAVDSNGDGLSDREDGDFDGLSLAEEALLGSDPTVPTLVLQRGWNLVAVPGLPAGEQTLAAQLGAGFRGFVWGWENNQYVLLTDQPMQPGRAYLVCVAEDVILDLRGLVPGSGEVTLAPGWNLVGPIRGGRWPGDAPGPVYRLGSYGAYELLDPLFLRPMTGYWVYSPAAATAQLP